MPDSPSFPPDTAAQQHADTVRDWFATDPRADTDSGAWDGWNDAAAALDALLADVERLTAERDETATSLRITKELYAELWRRTRSWLERAEAAERERDEALGRAARAEAAHELIAGTESLRLEAAEALAERRGEALRAAEGVLFALPRVAFSKRRAEVLAQIRAALADEGQEP